MSLHDNFDFPALCYSTSMHKFVSCRMSVSVHSVELDILRRKLLGSSGDTKDDEPYPLSLCEKMRQVSRGVCILRNITAAPQHAQSVVLKATKNTKRQNI